MLLLFINPYYLTNISRRRDPTTTTNRRVKEEPQEINEEDSEKRSDEEKGATEIINEPYPIRSRHKRRTQTSRFRLSILK